MTDPIDDLRTLLAGMDPALDPRRFVFATVREEEAARLLPRAIMLFREEEGMTAILEEEAALSLGIEHVFACRRITLRVHSALDAVGFLAAILPELAKAGMGVNPVSAYHHDHLFVPADKADRAMEVLKAISAERPVP